MPFPFVQEAEVLESDAVIFLKRADLIHAFFINAGADVRVHMLYEHRIAGFHTEGDGLAEIAGVNHAEELHAQVSVENLIYGMLEEFQCGERCANARPSISCIEGLPGGHKVLHLFTKVPSHTHVFEVQPLDQCQGP